MRVAGALRAAVAAVPLVVITAGGSVAAASGAADPFAECRRMLAARPHDYESAYCFYQTALAGRLWRTAPAVLMAVIDEQPGNPWLPLVLGHVHRGRDATAAEAQYRRAAAMFGAAGHEDGEVLARVSLRDLLFPLGRTAEAGREIDRVVAIAAKTRDARVRARAWTAQATHVHDLGGDLGLAYGLLKRAEAIVFPDGAYRMKRTLLSALGSVAYRLGRLDEALATYEALDALAAGAGELSLRANAHYNIVNTIATKETILPSPGGLGRLLPLAERALETALAAHNDVLAGRAHRMLAELTAAAGVPGRAREHARHCGALASRLRRPHDEAVCAWVEAALAGDPVTRTAAERRAEAATRRANSPRTEAFSAGRRMRLRWETAPRADALGAGLAALDAIERLRELQDEAGASAELFSTWTHDYYWLAGRLLERGDQADVGRAFSIAERLRARTLLERVDDGAGHRAAARSSPAAGGFGAIAAVQRQLLDPGLTAGERARRLAELAALERQLQDVRRRDASLRRGSLQSVPSFADLDGVRSSLGHDEALLSFQVGLWHTYDGEFGGGAWVIAVTARGHAAFRIPDRGELAALVPVYTGLLDRHDGVDVTAGLRLHDRLLGPALRWLPPEISRLVLIPDGPLHQLAFDALRATADGPPLAARFELVAAPSATLWRHWRAMPPRPGPEQRGLALADPTLAAGGADAAARNATLYQGLRLGRLPFARREAAAMARHLGAVDVLAGRQATERAVKSRDLRPYALVHFAAHAVADGARPERSAVLLAAGAPGEDGLLQSREIERLDLDGRIVVLSACQTAAGVVQSGEGVLSLARAFFAAGARAVIGTRWPIRDEDAAWLFDAFYRHLAAGRSLAAALRLAKGDAMAAGRPAAAWAGVVLLGNGDLRVGAGAAPDSTAARVIVVPMVAAAMAVGVWWRRRSRDDVRKPGAARFRITRR